MLHTQILTPNQIDLLPLIKQFSPQFYLVGGTAIALQIGHRRSIDFDLFTPKRFNQDRIVKQIEKLNFHLDVTFQDGDQVHGLINDTHLTFYEYPYHIPADIRFKDIIHMPSLINLSAMKAYALGRRAKWKDYVDLHFILRDHHSYSDITRQAEKLYGTLFNAKLFRQQLAYYEDVIDKEPIEYLDESPSKTQIQTFLTNLATQKL